MTRFAPGRRLSSLTETDWGHLAALLTKREFQLSYECAAMQMGPEKLLAVVLCLEADGLARATWLLYHCENHPMLSSAFRDGIPDLPIECHECDQWIADVRELSFDLICSLNGPPFEIVRDRL